MRKRLNTQNTPLSQNANPNSSSSSSLRFPTIQDPNPKKKPNRKMSAAAAALYLTSFPLPLSRPYRTPCRILASAQTRPEKLLIAGGRHLSGHVSISGSKNSALAILAGTLCCSGGGPSVLRGVPDLSDTEAMSSILRSLGASVEETGGGDLVVDASGVHSVEPCPHRVGRIRAGFFVVGPLVARFGEADVALPGGCKIGARPVDLYVRGLTALGAVVEMSDGKVRVRAANGKGLVGGRFHLDYPSVGATETLMMAATMAEGVTVLTNVAWEPEVVDLAQFLNASGACVKGAGTSTLVISGRKELHGAEFTVIPDRIEAGTFMAAAAITRSCVSLSPVVPAHLTSMMEKLTESGCRVTQTGAQSLEVSAVAAATGGDLRSFNVKTLPYPGFPTDVQAQFMALLATCTGSSIVQESVFENRMHHVKELQKLGARIKLSGNSAFIEGKKPGCTALSGGRVTAADLRGGAALVLAGLAADGLTEVADVFHIDRGYEGFEAKLRSLGADIKREIDYKQHKETISA